MEDAVIRASAAAGSILASLIAVRKRIWTGLRVRSAHGDGRREPDVQRNRVFPLPHSAQFPRYADAAGACTEDLDRKIVSEEDRRTCSTYSGQRDMADLEARLSRGQRPIGVEKYKARVVKAREQLDNA